MIVRKLSSGCRQIQVDVPRTYPSNPVFQRPRIQLVRQAECATCEKKGSSLPQHNVGAAA
jgi:hypothetical protein